MPGDQPVTYEDDEHQSGAELARNQVAAHAGTDDGERAANLQQDDVDTDPEEHPERTVSQASNAESARGQQEYARPELGTEVRWKVGESSPTEAHNMPHDGARDGATDLPGSALELVEQEISQLQRDVDEDPTPQHEEIDLQRWATAQKISEARTQKRENTSLSEHGKIHTLFEHSDSEDDGSTSDSARRNWNRRRFVLPLTITLVILTTIVGAGVLAVVFLPLSQESPTTETTESTPDVGATVSAAVAMAVTGQQTLVPADPSDASEEVAPTGFQPRTENVPHIPPSSTMLSNPENIPDPLVALYVATGGSNWRQHTNWLTDQPLGTWHGITTDAYGNVNSINLHDNNLTGAIPSVLGDLLHLQYLDLGANHLTGTIPDSLSGLTDLEELRLNNNRLTGKIPPDLGNLTKLRFLYLYRNLLSGPIPPELGNLVNLTNLALDVNTLSGPIPAELGNLTRLKLIHLSETQLSGEFPQALEGVRSPESVMLFGTQLTGCVPAHWQESNHRELQETGLPYCVK